MKKRIAVIWMLTAMGLVAGCGFGKTEELPLYATESTALPSKGVEGSQETEASMEDQVAKTTSAPAMNPDDVMDYVKDPGPFIEEGANETGEMPNSSETIEPDTATVVTREPVTPTTEPTKAPTQTPTPTVAPTSTPTPVQTPAPTAEPTKAPTQTPAQTPAPTVAPTTTPTPDNPCANGHTYGEPYMWREPTCVIPGDLCYVCIYCGAEKHVGGGYKEHDYEKKLMSQGDCQSPDYWKYSCKNCEDFYEETDFSQCESRHEWVTGSYQIFDEVTLEWVTITRTCCAYCNKDKE